MPAGLILVIDDSPLQRKRMSDILTGGGYEVLTAQDGLAGFQLAIKARPDVIISDIRMPELDGISLCKALKEHGTLRSTPIVFLSDLDSMEDLARGLEAGASDYLSKRQDGPEQVLAMAAVHTRYAQKIRQGKGSEVVAEVAAVSGEEFQSVDHIPVAFLEGLVFGLGMTNLRRQPIYLNDTARELLSLPGNVPVHTLSCSRFESFLGIAAKAWQANSDQFFFPCTLDDRALLVHLEQIRNSRRAVCGVMFLIQRG